MPHHPADRKPNLTVLLGAGASIPVGLPSTTSLTATVIEELSKASDRRGDVAAHRALVDVLLAAARRYYGWPMSFEQLLELLESAHALNLGWQYGSTVAEACLAVPAPAIANIFEGDFITRCIHSLSSTILYQIRDASDAVQQSENWATYQSFWAQLAASFDLTIGTLNYDTSLEQSLGLGPETMDLMPIDGENAWRLDVSQLGRPRRGHRILHLHGGIHFGDREYGQDANRFSYEAEFHELYWHRTPADAFKTGWGHSAPNSQSGRPLQIRRIVTGLHKPDKLLVEPLATYYQELGRQIIQCERLLVVGYGFNDAHINALLSRMNRAHGDRRRICVIDVVDPVEEHGSDNRHGMLETMHRWAEQRCLVHPDKQPYPFVSKKGHVKLFWRGLLEAAESADEITACLRAGRM